MAEIVYPRVWLVDNSPSRASQLNPGEVEGSDIVGVVLESALDTSEKRLGSPIGSINISASWTCFRAVPWIDIGYRHPFFKGFVFDEELEFFKCPTVEVSVLAFPVFGSVSDSSQLFHNHYVTFPETVHESPTHLVQNSVHIPPLFSAKPFQSAFSRLRAFGLKRRAELSKTVTFPKDGFASNLEAVRSDEETVDSDIHTNRIVAFRLWNSLIDCDVEEERLVSMYQDCVCRLGVFKKFSLVLSNIKQWFHSFLKSGNGCINPLGLVNKSKESRIQIHRKLHKFKKSMLSLFVGFSNSVPCSYSEVCRKIELSPRLSINHMVKCNRIKHSPLKSYVRNVVASISKSLNRAKQLAEIVRRRLKLADNGLREFHREAYMQVPLFKVSSSISPTVKTRGFP